MKERWVPTYTGDKINCTSLFVNLVIVKVVTSLSVRLFLKVVHKPTLFGSNQGASSFDLATTYAMGDSAYLTILPRFANSDHGVLSLMNRASGLVCFKVRPRLNICRANITVIQECSVTTILSVNTRSSSKETWSIIYDIFGPVTSPFKPCLILHRPTLENQRGQ